MTSIPFEEARRVLVLGAGTIGAGWTACFVWRGMQVDVVDPFLEGSTAEREIERNLDVLRGMAPGSEAGSFRVHETLDFGADSVDFVQEAVAENLDTKRQLLRTLESLIPDDTVVCTSTTALMPSDIQDGCRHPERVLAGHPFNPPHLLPLVEVVPGRATADWAVDWAMGFYRGIGKHPIRIRHEVKGHVANRLTSALFREAVHLLAEGVVSAADLDAAITQGPGLRWALMGPFLTYHMGGGAAGIEGYLAHLGDSHPARWAELGSPNLDAEARGVIIESVLQAYGGKTWEELSALRDDGLTRLLQLQEKHGIKAETDDLR